MKKHISCQFCGAQSTTLEAYFNWTVCSGCAATLRRPRSARASIAEEPRSAKPKRARCNCCGYLQSREQLHKFTLLVARYQDVYGRLVCEGCEQKMRTPCTSCGDYLHVSDINDAYANGVCFSCRARAERRRAEERKQSRQAAEEWHRLQSTQYRLSEAPRHARLLAEYAGERLEWPCSKEELKRVWRSASKRTHPDLGGSSEAFREAKASYDVLAEVAL